jgi:hypothetical protein
MAGLLRLHAKKPISAAALLWRRADRACVTTRVSERDCLALDRRGTLLAVPLLVDRHARFDEPWRGVSIKPAADKLGLYELGYDSCECARVQNCTSATLQH